MPTLLVTPQRETVTQPHRLKFDFNIENFNMNFTYITSVPLYFILVSAESVEILKTSMLR